MSCDRIPASKAVEAMRKTRQTGNEQAFVKCDGKVSMVVSGDDDSVNIGNLLGQCGTRADIFHTHPNGVLDLSDADRQVLAREDVQSVCVGDPNGNFVCERSLPKCSGSFKMQEKPDDD